MFLTHTVVLILIAILPLATSHGFLDFPISRNALGNTKHGFCRWGYNEGIPCSGDFMSYNIEEKGSGCGIQQTGTSVLSETYGEGRLAFNNTRYKTHLVAGEEVEFNVFITAHHGGRLEFRMQSLEDGIFDPIGSYWDTAELLTVNSFYPQCIPNTGDCGYEPCVEQKTCAQVSEQEYITNDFKIKVQLPNKICRHCVIQWRYITSNSCKIASSCVDSEQFWNCADIQLFESNTDFTEPYSINVQYVRPPDAPVVPNVPPPEDPLNECIRTSYDVSDAFCKGVRCDPKYNNTCTFLRNCRSNRLSVTDEHCQSLKCNLDYQSVCTTKEKSTTTCHSISPSVTTSWCISNGCIAVTVCSPGPDPSAIVQPTVSPTFGAPTIAPVSVAPSIAAPTIAPSIAAPTIAPTSAAPTDTCHSISPSVPTSWCIANGCIAADSTVCSPGPDPSAIVQPTLSPTFGAPTIAPTSAAPTVAPTDAPTNTGTVAPTDAPTNSGGINPCTNGEWDQCGGFNYNGESCCPDGMTCEGGLWWNSCKIIATQAAQQSGNSSSSSSTSITHVIVACLCVLLFLSVAFLYWWRFKTPKSSTAEDEIETGVVSIVY